jgi:hypothetical protein
VISSPATERCGDRLGVVRAGRIIGVALRCLDIAGAPSAVNGAHGAPAAAIAVPNVCSASWKRCDVSMPAASSPLRIRRSTASCRAVRRGVDGRTRSRSRPRRAAGASVADASPRLEGSSTSPAASGSETASCRAPADACFPLAERSCEPASTTRPSWTSTECDHKRCAACVLAAERESRPTGDR